MLDRLLICFCQIYFFMNVSENAYFKVGESFVSLAKNSKLLLLVILSIKFK